MTKSPIVSDNEQECTSYFKSVIAEIPAFREAAIVDTDGKSHCSSIPFPQALDIGGRIEFDEPLNTSKLTVGTITQGRAPHSTSIHLSMPYKDDGGSIKGVIVLILNPEKLAESLPAGPWRSEHRLVVLDGEGSLVLTLPTNDLQEAGARWERFIVIFIRLIHWNMSNSANFYTQFAKEVRLPMLEPADQLLKSRPSHFSSQVRTLFLLAC